MSWRQGVTLVMATHPLVDESDQDLGARRKALDSGGRSARRSGLRRIRSHLQGATSEL